MRNKFGLKSWRSSFNVCSVSLLSRFLVGFASTYFAFPLVALQKMRDGDENIAEGRWWLGGKAPEVTTPEVRNRTIVLVGRPECLPAQDRKDVGFPPIPIRVISLS